VYLIHNKQIKTRDNLQPKNTLQNSSGACEFAANSIHAQGANSHTQKSHHKYLETCVTPRVHKDSIKLEEESAQRFSINDELSAGKVQYKDNVHEGRSLTCICGPISFPVCVRTMSMTVFNLSLAPGSKQNIHRNTTTSWVP
jgi:hypothetical protein